MGTTIWGIERLVGQLQVGAYRVDAQQRVQPIKRITPIQPCDVADGVPDHIAFWTESTGLLYCENDVISTRLMTRTTNAGRNFKRLADNRPDYGLDGGGSVIDMDVSGDETVWLQFTGELGLRRGAAAHQRQPGSRSRSAPLPL